MRANFEASLTFTLGFEGGYVNHPKDPGGHTNKGITLATLRRYEPNASVARLKTIPMDLVRRIYRDGYWNTVSGDSLAAGVDGATFDYAVNSGPAAAKKSLNAVVGGPDHETVKKLCKRRLSIYQTFKHWKNFGKGWTNRITAGEALWVKWALVGAGELLVKKTLEKEAGAAKKKASQQTGGAVTAGGGGAVASPEAVDQVAGYVLAGGVVLVAAVVVFLIWRARINKQRAKAYAQEAAAL